MANVPTSPTSSERMTNASDFWEDFEKYSPRLLAVIERGDVRRAFEALDHLLTGYGYTFCFDLAADERAAVLTFSPEGDPVVAEEIDAFLAHAPRLEGWRINGRRERKDPREVPRIIRQLYDLEIAEVRFLIDDGGHCGPRIAIYLPAAEPLSDQERVGLAAALLWHSLGEDLVLRERISAGIIPAPGPPGAITLHDLRQRFPAG
ncbi:MAG TPA: hypothetical protein VGE52_12245 [Pirellulales bacterium]